MSDFIGTLRNAIGFTSTDDYDYDYEDEYDDAEDSKGSEIKLSVASFPTRKRSTEDRYLQEDGEEQEEQMRVVVLSPAVYEDARLVCDNLKAFLPVVVKLENLQKAEAQRVVDFIMGACYYMNGRVEEIKGDVFLVTPSMIGIEKSSESPSEAEKASILKKFRRS